MKFLIVFLDQEAGDVGTTSGKQFHFLISIVRRSSGKLNGYSIQILLCAMEDKQE